MSAGKSNYFITNKFWGKWLLKKMYKYPDTSKEHLHLSTYFLWVPAPCTIYYMVHHSSSISWIYYSEFENKYFNVGILLQILKNSLPLSTMVCIIKISILIIYKLLKCRIIIAIINFTRFSNADFLNCMKAIHFITFYRLIIICSW